MFTQPDDLSDDDIVAAVARGWGVTARHVEYAPVGFGSHHWRIEGETDRWFVSVDDLEAKRRDASETRLDAGRRLTAALSVARSLRDAGLDFVIAPTRTRRGEISEAVGDRYSVAIYPQVEGETHSYGQYPTADDRLAVLDLVAALHGVNPSVAPSAMPDDFAIPSRDELMVTLTDPDLPWGPGPFASPARDLLRRHAEAVSQLLAEYDDLVRLIAGGGARRVLTHGEPHRGNTITTAHGVVLIDWDTALLAPPERDLWMLMQEDPSITDRYTERTGVPVDGRAVRLYRLWWDLCEISLYTAALRRPHRDVEDTRVTWENLVRFLDPSRW